MDQEQNSDIDGHSDITQSKKLFSNILLFIFCAVTLGAIVATTPLFHRPAVVSAATSTTGLTVSAGADRTIILPTNSVVLTATTTGGTGTISHYAWSRVRGTGIIESPTTATTIVSDLSPGFSVFKVKVTDSNGNTDTSKVTIRLAYDTVDPSIQLTSPGNNTTVSGTVPITTSATDNIGVDHVDFYAGDIRIGTTSASPYTFNWDTTQVANGTYTISAKAYDAADNSRVSNTYSVTVANTSTSTVDTGTSSTATRDTTAPTISFRVPLSASGTVTLSATATDNTGVTKVSFYRNTTRIATDSTASGGDTYEVPWDTTGVSDGIYSLYAVAYDAAGNSKSSPVATTTVTNEVPSALTSSSSTTTSTQDASTSTSQTQTSTVVSSSSARVGDTVGISFGDTLHLKSDAQISAIFDDLNAEGVTWVRFDLSWEDVQWSGSTSYDWSGIDRIVSEAAAHHLKLLPDIAYTPPWARSAVCSGSGGSCPPANMQSYAHFVQAAAARYTSKGIDTWEIWNEPNIAKFWLPSPSPSGYTEMLKAAYSSIKAVNPSATVISAGLSPAVNNATHIAPIDFLKAMYADGAKNYFDAVGFHPYAFPALPSQYERWSGWSQMNETNPSLRSVMASNGDDTKKIWITEYGAPTGGPGNIAWVGYPNINDSSVDHVTDDLQSKIVIDGITEANKDAWTGPLFIYSYQDLGTSTDTIENFFGMKRFDGSHKTLYNALRTLLLQPA